MKKASGIPTLYEVVIEIPEKHLERVQKTITLNKVKIFSVIDMPEDKKALSFQLKIKMLHREIVNEEEEFKKVKHQSFHLIHMKLGSSLASHFNLADIKAMIDEKEFYFNFKRISQDIPQDIKSLQFAD